MLIRDTVTSSQLDAQVLRCCCIIHASMQSKGILIVVACCWAGWRPAESVCRQESDDAPVSSGRYRQQVLGQRPLNPACTPKSGMQDHAGPGSTACRQEVHAWALALCLLRVRSSCAGAAAQPVLPSKSKKAAHYGYTSLSACLSDEG